MVMMYIPPSHLHPPGGDPESERRFFDNLDIFVDSYIYEICPVGKK